MEGSPAVIPAVGKDIDPAGVAAARSPGCRIRNQVGSVGSVASGGKEAAAVAAEWAARLPCSSCCV